MNLFRRWFRYEYPSLKRELAIVCSAKTGHEDGPRLHETAEYQSRAVPAEPRATGIDREELRKVGVRG